jgi:hypothetical protein
MKKIEDGEIIKACKEELTMAKAAIRLGLHYNTFIRKAKKLGVYKPNQGAKGSSKPSPLSKIPTKEILMGSHPHYQTNKLRLRLISEGIKNEECEVCGIKDWNGKKLSFELDHIDGDRTNHRLENLRIVCPNCHSQTDTYRGKNI